MSTDIAIGFGVWDEWMSKVLGDVGLTIVETKNMNGLDSMKEFMNRRIIGVATNFPAGRPKKRSTPPSSGDFGMAHALIRLRHRPIGGISITQKYHWNWQRLYR